MEHENEMFPDEVDTPQDIDARARFQRFVVEYLILWIAKLALEFKTFWESKDNYYEILSDEQLSI